MFYLFKNKKNDGQQYKFKFTQTEIKIKDYKLFYIKENLISIDNFVEILKLIK